MWIFSSKSSDGTTSGSVLGSHGADDPLASYSLLPPPLDESLSGPFNLHWMRQSATSQRKPGDRVTVFSCHLPPSGAAPAISDALSQTVKRMKTLRHPNILNWRAGTENPSPKSSFHIITEEVFKPRAGSTFLN